MDASKLRAWWAHKQGLLGELEAKLPAEVLNRTGWARSVGGVNPYLTLFSRAGTSREASDKAAADLEIYELPTARGCTYVLPRSDYAVGLKAGQRFRAGEIQVAKSLGVTDQEIDRLCDAILKALESGDKDPAAIRTAVGDASRSLGEEGKKKGLTTTLPAGLSRLQSEGRILRKPVNGRFDVQRYTYTLWRSSPLANSALTEDQAFDALARLYFGWISPASVANFAWFTALPKRKVKTILDRLPLVPIESGSDLLMLKGDLDAFASFVPPKDPIYRLVGSIDGLFNYRREVGPFFAEEDLGRLLPTSKGDQAAGSLQDLTNFAILDRGRIVGVWEYDYDRSQIVWTSYVPKNEALLAEIGRVEEFVRDQLGDARSFSLGSPESRRPMIEKLLSASA